MSQKIRAIKDTRKYRQANDNRPAGRGLGHFLGQLRERKVCRAAVEYAIASWLMLQLGELVFPLLGLPGWTLTLVMLLLVMFFPVAMILAWVLVWTDEGLKFDVPTQQSAASTSPGDRIINMTLLVAAVLLSALVVLDLLFDGSDAGLTAPSAAASHILSVRPFTVSGDRDAPRLEGLESDIRHQLLRVGSRLSVAADESRLALDSVQNDDVSRWALEGKVTTEGDRTRVLVLLIDLNAQRYEWSTMLVARNADGVREELAVHVAQAVMQYTDATLGPAPTVPDLEIGDDVPLSTSAAL